MAAVVQYDERGEVRFFITHGETMLIIDERTPHDRVFQITRTMHPDELALILRGSAVGSAKDERHAAVVARVEELFSGKPRLSVVTPDIDPA